MSARVAVLAGSGKTGQAVRRGLAARGVDSVAVGSAAWATPADLAAALRGCDAAYLIAPNLHPDEPDHVRRALAAAREVGIERVVHHSVAAPYVPVMPHHLGKAVAEHVVRTSGLAWTVLQPCAYTQNLLPGVADGVLRAAYDPDAPFGLVDLDDVGEAAAEVLVGDGHVGSTYELGGPTLVSVHDVARAAGEVLGREVAVERTTPEEWVTGEGAGLDERPREWLRAMFAYYDDHGLPTGAVPLTALLGRAPTPVADVVRRELT